MFLSADTSQRGRPVPRNDFSSREVPQVVITGYGGKLVTLELRTSDAALVAKSNFKIPEEQMTREDKGIVFKDTFGTMRPVRRVEIRNIPAGLIVQLKPPPPGNYEVRLIVDGAIRQTAPLRMGGF